MQQWFVQCQQYYSLTRRRACAKRVTVVVESVSLSVCGHVALQFDTLYNLYRNVNLQMAKKKTTLNFAKFLIPYSGASYKLRFDNSRQCTPSYSRGSTTVSTMIQLYAHAQIVVVSSQQLELQWLWLRFQAFKSWRRVSTLVPFIGPAFTVQLQYYRAPHSQECIIGTQREFPGCQQGQHKMYYIHKVHTQ